MLTTINLFCGFLAVTMAVSGRFHVAGWIIFIAGIFDALDGRIARASGQNSQFGLFMDSFADIISAGIAPSLLIYVYYLKDIGNHAILGLLLGFLPLLFAAFRLARFNVVTLRDGHKPDFTGMPAPMAASALASLVVLHVHVGWTILLRAIIVLAPLVSLAMVSNLKYEGFPKFSLKEKGGNRFKLIVFFGAILSVFIVPEYTLFVFMMIYFVSGPVKFLYDLFAMHGSSESVLEAEELIADHRVQ